MPARVGAVGEAPPVPPLIETRRVFNENMAFLLAKNTYLGGDLKNGVSRRDTPLALAGDGTLEFSSVAEKPFFIFPPVINQWTTTVVSGRWGGPDRRGQGTGLGAFGLEARGAVSLRCARGSRLRKEIQKTRKKTNFESNPMLTTRGDSQRGTSAGGSDP